jgi:hypothetical protein
MKNLSLKLFKLFYPYFVLANAALEVGFDVKYAFASRGEWRWWMPLVGVSVVRDDGSIIEATVSTIACSIWLYGKGAESNLTYSSSLWLPLPY